MELLPAPSSLAVRYPILSFRFPRLRTVRERAYYLGYLMAEAKENNPDALYTLGLIYEKGVVCRKNESRAFHWFLRAAKVGHPDALSRVIGSFDKGLGCILGFAESLDCLNIAAKKGVAVAYYYLSYIYRSGIGVPRDDQKALNYLVQAAKHGHLSSQILVVALEFLRYPSMVHMATITRAYTPLESNRPLALLVYDLDTFADNPRASSRASREGDLLLRRSVVFGNHSAIEFLIANAYRDLITSKDLHTRQVMENNLVEVSETGGISLKQSLFEATNPNEPLSEEFIDDLRTTLRKVLLSPVI
jgi:TPR repeat protein